MGSFLNVKVNEGRLIRIKIKMRRACGCRQVEVGGRESGEWMPEGGREFVYDYVYVER
jgi:hypothetical protein